MNIDLSKLLEIVKDPDLKIKISELVGENLQLKEANFILKEELKKLSDLSEIKKNLVYENDLYYLKDDLDKTGLYCSKCWDSEQKLIRMHSFKNVQASGFSCPNCKSIVYNK
ncbi:MAG TPA: hypothetical protein VN711_00895 [Candidatus Saccharimonadales bacterium]|nr:hypothetical protein [Candidatus Saccharimonadales bacterium]